MTFKGRILGKCLSFLERSLLKVLPHCLKQNSDVVMMCVNQLRGREQHSIIIMCVKFLKILNLIVLYKNALTYKTCGGMTAFHHRKNHHRKNLILNIRAFSVVDVY